MTNIFKNIYRIFFNPFFLISPIKSFKKLIYNLEKDLEYNKKLLANLGFDNKKIKLQLKDYNLDYYNYHISWHYHLFLGLSQKLSKIKILEIGTHSGEFTSFLSKIFSDSHIVTIDLPENDERFNNNNTSGNNLSLEKFLKKRKINLNRENIKFLEIDSVNLLDHFNKNSFDLIWIDGDHLNPQVTIDIKNSMILLNKNGIMLCDDVIKNDLLKSGPLSFVSSDSFKNLELLKKSRTLSSEYLIKRMTRNNSLTKKFISISKLI